jgi:hypothetical protein
MQRVSVNSDDNRALVCIEPKVKSRPVTWVDINESICVEYGIRSAVHLQCRPCR